MGCQSTVKVGNNLTFSVCTHDPDTGILTDAAASPTYRVYEDETATALLSGTMAKLDDANTTGFYTEQIACTAANGFEDGKTYTIYIEATVSGNTGGISYGFRANDPLLATVPGTYASGTAGHALGRLGSGNVTVVYPVSSTNTVTIIRGDDYSATEGRSIDWTDTSAAWPDLTSGSILFTAEKITKDCTLSVSGSIVTPSGANKTVRAEPTSAQTSVLLLGNYKYDVQVTFSNGHRVTLVADSPLKVLEDYS